jgi:hypothetical protein
VDPASPDLRGAVGSIDPDNIHAGVKQHGHLSWLLPGGAECRNDLGSTDGGAWHGRSLMEASYPRMTRVLGKSGRGRVGAFVGGRLTDLVRVSGSTHEVTCIGGFTFDVD